MQICPKCEWEIKTRPKTMRKDLDQLGILFLREWNCFHCKNILVTVELHQDKLLNFIENITEKVIAKVSEAKKLSKSKYIVVATKREKKLKLFHRTECPWVQYTRSPIKWNDRDEAIEDGYHPCRTCNS